MGYLGSDLDDYYSYQLIEKVIEQIETGDTGNRRLLADRLVLAAEKFKAKYEHVKPKPKKTFVKRHGMKYCRKMRLYCARTGHCQICTVE